MIDRNTYILKVLRYGPFGFIQINACSVNGINQTKEWGWVDIPITSGTHSNAVRAVFRTGSGREQ